jgi:hypothetical protein
MGTSTIFNWRSATRTLGTCFVRAELNRFRENVHGLEDAQRFQEGVERSLTWRLSYVLVANEQSTRIKLYQVYLPVNRVMEPSSRGRGTTS